MDHDRRIVNNRTAPRSNKMWIIGAVALAFIVLAFGGSYVTSRHMNTTADIHDMSAGRPGDAVPNGLQEQQNAPAARGPSTTGANPNSSVPPATR
jgi:hypothetical protein